MEKFKPQYRHETDEIVRDITQAIMEDRNIGIRLVMLRKEKGIVINPEKVRQLAYEARITIAAEIHKQIADSAEMEPSIGHDGFRILV